jgi:hypothetical protein
MALRQFCILLTHDAPGTADQTEAAGTKSSQEDVNTSPTSRRQLLELEDTSPVRRIVEDRTCNRETW